MLTLVSGVTCAGKSTYIAERLTRDPEARVVFPREIKRSPQPLTRAAFATVYVHLNIASVRRADLAPADQVAVLAASPVVRQVLDHPLLAGALVLTAPPGELADRARSRTEVEPLLRPRTRPYPSDRAAHVATLDVAGLTAAWADLLQGRGLATSVIDTGSGARQAIA